MKERIAFLDTLKGIGIVLVVYGHIPSSLSPFMYIFHMPLFFFISGILFNEKYSFREVFVRKSNSLLLPFVFFYVLGFLWSWCLFVWDNHSILKFDFFSFFDFFSGKESFSNIYVWFLWVLFLVNIAYCIIQKKIQIEFVRGIVVVSLFVLGVYLGYNNFNIPFFIDSVPFALLFFYVGNKIKRFSIIMNKSQYDWMIILLCLILFTLFISLNPVNCDIRSNRINGSIVSFVVESISMIFLLFFFCKRISASLFLNYFGQNSLFILGTHSILLSFLSRFFTKYSLNIITQTMLGSFIYLILALLLSIPIIFVLKKYFPFLMKR